MFGVVLPFSRSSTQAPKGWQADELAECYRVVALLARNGLAVDIETGLSDEGDPWAVIIRSDTGDVLVHLARVDGQFVVASAAGSAAQRGQNLRAVVDAAVAASPLTTPHRDLGVSGDRLFLHPAAVMAAFIITAWAHTEMWLGGGDRGAPGRTEPGTRADNASGNTETQVGMRGPVPADLPPVLSGHVLAQATTALLAVMVALEGSTESARLIPVSPEAFVQAVLAHEQPVAEVQEDMPPPELQPGLITVHPMLGLLQSEDVTVRLDAAEFTLAPAGTLPKDPGWVAATRPDDATSTAGSLPHTFFMGPAAPPVAAEQLMQDRLLLEATWSPAPAPQKVALAAVEMHRSAEAGPPVSKTAGSPGPHEAPSAAPTTAPQLGPIYEQAARLLHLLPTAQTASWDGASGSPFDNPARTVAFSSGAASQRTADATPAHKVAPSPDTERHEAAETLDGASSDMATRSTAASVMAAPHAAAADATMTMAAPAAALTTTSAEDPGPQGNARLILDFTTDKEHVADSFEAWWLTLVADNQAIAEAKQVLVFDAPWLAGYSFMLMPGVAMIEDDLLGGSAQVSRHFRQPAVTLHLGDDLSLRLEGILDLGA